MLPSADKFADALDVIRRLNDCESVADVQHETMESLANLFNASACLFVVHPEKEAFADKRLMWYGIDHKFEQMYKEKFDEDNPFVGWTRSMRKPEPGGKSTGGPNVPNGLQRQAEPR